MRIALDAMGGDFAPQATVEGAYLYQKETKKRNELILVGNKEVNEKFEAECQACRTCQIHKGENGYLPKGSDSSDTRFPYTHGVPCL